MTGPGTACQAGEPEPWSDGVLERLSRLEAVVFPDNPDRWMPLSAVHKATGIPHRTLIDWARSSRCPAHKFRGQWFVDPSWVATQAAQRPKGTAS